MSRANVASLATNKLIATLRRLAAAHRDERRLTRRTRFVAPQTTQRINRSDIAAPAGTGLYLVKRLRH
jgi:hypothetical protein